MATLNKRVKGTQVNIIEDSNAIYTHEGAIATRTTDELNLRRSVMATMLWEDTFYESGVEIAKRISELVPKVSPKTVSDIAIEARTKMKLRHVPLLLAREMARHDSHRYLVSDTLNSIVNRADELAEFLAIYWKEKKQPISSQVKKGLARAFTKFTEYDLAKYNRDNAIKLRDVLFMTHPKPLNNMQAATWKKLVDGTLEIPDTWEVALSGGQDKKETWMRLMEDNKLGILAFLRNLRNMQQVDVPIELMKEYLLSVNPEKALPFRFISAAKYAPRLEPELELSMFKCLEKHERMNGRTVLLVDVSGSMDSPVSSKSDLQRTEAAYALSMLCREICQDVRIFSFSSDTKEIPARRGFALRDVIDKSQFHACTYLGKAIDVANKCGYDRLIVFTDEQSHDTIPNVLKGSKAYMINVASYQNGVSYRDEWNHIDGFSEAIIDYIMEYEKLV